MKLSLIASLAIISSLTIAQFGLSVAWGHGDVTPQPVNTDALPDVGEEWLNENPYRNASRDVWTTALEIGASGYNQNCARCHGLGAVSGGIAPDLRFLEAEEYGDEWYISRYRSGYTQGGVTKMPAFGELLGQKAAWAIRTYIEARPDSDSVEAFAPRLKKIRDTLKKWSKNPAQARPAQVRQITAELKNISENIETLSGSPIADSGPFRAYQQIGTSAASYGTAADTLTVSLSASH